MIVPWFLPRRLNGWLYLLAFLAILAALVLSVVSYLRICTVECSAAHNWTLFGLPFEYTGLVFFPILLIIHGLALKYRELYFVGGLMLAGALGAEVEFIRVQKLLIAAWCPICLSIAACIAIAAACYVIMYATKLLSLIKHDSKYDLKGEYMNHIWKGFTALSVFFLGFLISIAGVSKIDLLAAQETSIKERLYFGDKSSPIEVYMFTDWSCPACRELEPELEKMAPEIMKKAKLVFVDHAIHLETLNYSPYNVSFIINDKKEYFRLREKLTSLSINKTAPTAEDVEKIAKSVGVKYEPLPGSDMVASQIYFSQLAEKFKIDKTPMMVIVNTKTKKGKKFSGIPEITTSNVLKAISTLSETK